MAAKKYLGLGTDGEVAQIAASITSAGAGNEGDLVALDATGKLSSTVMPSGIGAEQQVITAAEELAQWDIVNIYLDVATLKARKADGGTNKYIAHAYCPAGITNAATGAVQMEGVVTSSGMTPGKVQFLSVTTPGTRTEIVPSGTGKLNQRLGHAISETSYFFQPGNPIVLA